MLYQTTFQGVCGFIRSAKRRADVQYKFVESFSGPGGMSLGLANAGLDTAFAFDIDPPSVETHSLNLGNHAEVADASKLTGEEILERIGISVGELPVFAGGPPCQGFSKQKRGAHLGDNRNNLVNDYIRLVEELRPKIFVFENVAIFGQKRGRQYVKAMHEKLHSYQIDFTFVNSADFGLAQTRERFLVVGKRSDISASFYFPTREKTNWKTVADVFAGLPEPPSDHSEHPQYPNHQSARVSAANIHRFSFVPQGGGWKDIPFEYRLPCHQRIDATKGGWPDVYGRLRADGQCPTITGGFDSFSRGRYGHPTENRPLTPREAARLQGFPDDFVFVGNRSDVRKQIGNAVPPPVAEAVGIEILKTLLIHDGYLDEDRPHARLLEESS
ncbi:MAG: DNA cytosine methyltransferase [Verrucomicrobiales bacterium]